jgi:hypothetical protein
MPRTITETQYTALRGYRDGRDRWTNGGPLQTLVARGLIARAPHDRTMYRITTAGTAALVDFETRYGVQASA